MELKIPERGFVLLDTNVLIDTSKYPDNFLVLHNELKRLHISSVVESTIRFEFLRGLRNVIDGEKLLSGLCGENHLVLNPDKDTFDRALKISQIYVRNDNKQVKIADVIIAAQIAKYAKGAGNANELLLATQNHKDFPPILFDRVDEMLITIPDGSIKIVGFYRFKVDRFNDLQAI
jgi:predicted nucleic acid-binding protein